MEGEAGNGGSRKRMKPSVCFLSSVDLAMIMMMMICSSGLDFFFKKLLVWTFDRMKREKEIREME